jgi:hypothetical protein
MSRSDTYPYEAVLEVRGDRALLVRIEDELFWLPTSVVGEYADAKIGDTLELHIPEWLCEARGIY